MNTSLNTAEQLTISLLKIKQKEIKKCIGEVIDAFKKYPITKMNLNQGGIQFGAYYTFTKDEVHQIANELITLGFKVKLTNSFFNFYYTIKLPKVEELPVEYWLNKEFL